MAILKSVRTPCATAEYHRISSVAIHWKNKEVAFRVVSYQDKSFRDDPNGGCVAMNEMSTVDGKFPFTDDHMAAMCDLLNVADNHRLLSVEMNFNGGKVSCKASMDKDVAGEKFNWEEQPPVFSLADMPVDFLAVLYPLASEMFPYGEEM